jgi:ribosomal protein S18 acetylase RimI-like enzyme
MTTNIREAVPADAHVLAALNRFVQDVHLLKRPDQFKQTNVPELATWYESILKDSTARIWIAEDGGVAVGYVLAVFHERPENALVRSRRWCEIDQIAVDPAHRRKGIARALVVRVMDGATARGIREAEATSWYFNDEAHEFFRRLGFVSKTVRFEHAVSE